MAAGLPVGAATAARSGRGDARLMQGPMVGAATPTGVPIWGRSSSSYDWQVEFSTAPDLRQARRSTSVSLKEDSDFTGVTELTGLEPDTRYFYRPLLDGKPDKYLAGIGPFSFKTAPARPQPFRVAFGSCARYGRDPRQRIWEGVIGAQPDLFFWLGDNVYVDSLNPRMFAEEYRRQRSVPGYQPLGRSVPQLAIWDDHDYGLNDHDRTNPMKETALEQFRRYWANPSYGLPATPGVFFTYRYGGVDFFFLDGRYHRDPNTDPDGPGKTMLGAGQRAWLERQLEASDAPFKVLVSGSGWSRAKGAGGDAWSSFLHERDALFRFIRDESITGVVLISGDTHVAELNAIPLSDDGGYDLYDLTSSPLAQNPAESWLVRDPELRLRLPFFASANFGLLSFRFEPDPVLIYNAYDPSGRAAWRPIRIAARELVNGVASARDKADPGLTAFPLR